MCVYCMVMGFACMSFVGLDHLLLPVLLPKILTHALQRPLHLRMASDQFISIPHITKSRLHQHQHLHIHHLLLRINHCHRCIILTCTLHPQDMLINQSILPSVIHHNLAIFHWHLRAIHYPPQIIHRLLTTIQA